MRTIPPASRPITSIKPLYPERSTLKNGVPLYILRGGNEPIINISLLFPAGSRFQDQRLIAGTTNKLVTEGGSKNHSAASLAETMDFHGSTLHTQSDKDYATISLLTLRKHLKALLPVFSDVLQHPIFPQKELRIYLKQDKQDWQIEQTKPKFQARVEMSQLLYGAEHPYGYILQESDYGKVHPVALRDFFNQHYLNPLGVLISGQSEEEDLQIISRYLGDLPFGWLPQPLPVSTPVLPSIDTRRKHHEVPNAVQSAIRIATGVCRKTHPDYVALMVMNTMLGGYFGSRLMRSIREDKGYTYGIHSILVNMVHADSLIIATEVGSEVTLPALEAIYQEMEILQNVAPPEQELFRVKQFLMGEMLRSFDGPFQQEDRLMGLLELGLPLNYFDHLPGEIQSITPQHITATAQKYLLKENLFELVAGNPNIIRHNE